jgi:hypothetical protein
MEGEDRAHAHFVNFCLFSRKMRKICHKVIAHHISSTWYEDLFMMEFTI